MITTFGVGLGLLGIVSAIPLAFIILLAMDTGNGILAITLVTFFQRKAPKEMLGRIMSLVMLAGVGLQPISQVLTGALIKVSFGGMFIGAGGLMLLVALWLAFQPVSRMIQHVTIYNIPAPGD